MTLQYLIADGGSTKTSWMLTSEGERTCLDTPGINPVRDTEEEIERVLDECRLPIREGSLSIFYYGAGCIPPYSDVIRQALCRRFPNAVVCVESDLLGAAHALCGSDEGIACILGTGSNSCLYDGSRIVANVSPLGYILGDEGSGAVLGKRLIGNLLKGQMSPTLVRAFTEETSLTPPDIIDKVYRQPMPNRFLASLVPFLGRHRNESEIHEFLVGEFRDFFRRNVALYRRPDLPVHFVGGVAQSYADELREAADLEGHTVGTILQRPIDALADYLIKKKAS